MRPKPRSAADEALAIKSVIIIKPSCRLGVWVRTVLRAVRPFIVLLQHAMDYFMDTLREALCGLYIL